MEVMNAETKHRLLDSLSAARETLTREYWHEYKQIAETEYPTIGAQMRAGVALGELARATEQLIEASGHLMNVPAVPGAAAAPNVIKK